MRMSGPAVEARDLTLGYGSHVALKASNFTVPRPGITAVIGPNGSGKSTLLNAIAGLLEPMSGSVEVHVARSQEISYVLQSTKVNDALPVTVEEVVTMGRYASIGRFRRLTSEDRRAVTNAMERTGIASQRRRHLHHLSGGQRQRAFVAQGLAQEHSILMLDEPLSGIDVTTSQAIDDVIHKEVEEGCAVILTTHDLTEASVADHVILVAGRVVASGPPEDVMTPENLAAAYGTSVLHPGAGPTLIDDPAHAPVGERHSHRAPPQP